MGRGRRLPVSLLALLVAGGVFVQAGSTSGGQSGGIFRISLAPQSGLDYIDPALSYTPPGWALLDTMCARLMTYPDRRPPKAFEVVPEVAVGYPRIARRLQAVHVPPAEGIPLQRRVAGPGERVRARDQPHPGARCPLARCDVHAGHRRRSRRAGGPEEDGEGRRGAREHARRAVHEPGPGLRQADDAAVLLRGAARPPLHSGGRRRVRLGGPLLRSRVPPRRACRDPEEPLLRREAAAPPRRLRRRPPRPLTHRDAPAHRPQRGRLGPHDRGRLHGSLARPRGEARCQQDEVLRQARTDHTNARFQLLASALPEEPRAPQGDQLRARPSGAAGDRRRSGS